MTPKERSTWMMSIYNAQYEDYEMEAGRIDLTEEYKELLREKKAMLTEVYPAITLYTKYAESGVTPGSDLETLIVSLLNRLMMAVTTQ